MGNKTVLVVDDSTFIRNRVKQALTSGGYEVEEAENGRLALEKCGTGAYACVVTDLVMPELDGIGFLQGLREASDAVPVVVLTADIQNTTRVRCQELGVAQFLNKPANTTEILHAVNGIVVT